MEGSKKEREEMYIYTSQIEDIEKSEKELKNVSKV